MGSASEVSRSEHEAVVEAAERGLDKEPWRMSVRRSTVEHPFGTLKSWMRHTHFLTQTLPRVRTEMSLHILANDLKRIWQAYAGAIGCSRKRATKTRLSNRSAR